jgi:hypothetical protein
MQIESGFLWENVDAQARNYSYPSVLWKIGLNDRFETRIISEYVSVKDNAETVAGLNPVTLGFKVNFCQEKGILPTTSFIGHMTTSNLGSKEFHTSYSAPKFRFTMQHTLSETFSLAYNLGAEWDGENPGQSYIYTLTSGISLGEKLSCYVELFGNAPAHSKPVHRCDGGFTYLFNNDFIVDLSGGLGLTDNSSDYYLAFGVSYRFKLFK